MKRIISDLVMHAVSLVLKLLAIIIPKQKGLVILGASAGKRFADNSAIVYQYILDHHKELRPVWLANSPKVIDQVKALGGEAYARRSVKGIWLSLRTPIFLTSHGIKDALMYVPIIKRPKHVYLHHGIPLRRGWLDIKDAPKKSIQSTHQKIRVSNYMIAPSTFAADQQNRLLPIGIDKFALTGLPRNDVFFDKTFDLKQFKTEFKLHEFTKVILYCPTWRPWGPTQFFPFEDYDLDGLISFLGLYNVCLILRPHHVDLNHRENSDFWKSIEHTESIKLLTHDICPNVNQLCRISDALITDYSSIYYDYLIMDKPVMFLCYDYERYNNEIGFYPDFQAITHGHKPDNQVEFLTALTEITEGKDLFSVERNQLKKTFYKHMDGQSTRRVVALIKDLIDG